MAVIDQCCLLLCCTGYMRCKQTDAEISSIVDQHADMCTAPRAPVLTAAVVEELQLLNAVEEHVLHVRAAMAVVHNPLSHVGPPGQQFCCNSAS